MCNGGPYASSSMYKHMKIHSAVKEGPSVLSKLKEEYQNKEESLKLKYFHPDEYMGEEVPIPITE